MKMRDPSAVPLVKRRGTFGTLNIVYAEFFITNGHLPLPSLTWFLLSCRSSWKKRDNFLFVCKVANWL